MGTVKYSGPVASFHCPTNAEIRSLKVHFSPKQLGEGTPSPENVREIIGWDGVEVYKCGKNLFDLDESKMISDGWNRFFPNPIKKSGIYSISCSQQFGDTGSLGSAIFFVDEPENNTEHIGNALVGYNFGNTIFQVTNKSVSEEQANAKYILFGMSSSGCTFKSLQDAKIQIEESSTSTSYEPYRGETVDYEFGVLGKNKLNIGTVSFTGYKKYEIEGGLMPATYTASALITSDDEDSTKSLMLFQNENSTIKQIFLERNIRNAVTFTLTQPATSVYIYSGDSYQRSVGDATTWSEVQLELSSTATTYEPYDPNKTVYGGWVDLVSGEVCEEWGKYTFTGNESDNVFRSYNSTYNGWGIYTAQLSSGIGLINSGNPSTQIKSDIFYSATSRGYAADSDKTYVIRTWSGKTPGANINAPFLCGEFGETTITDFKAWLSQYKPTIMYNLETPNTYHLAPTQLQTFLAQNNIWSNADYVEVEYDLHETQNILARKQFIVANQPHIVKPAAAPLQNFVTDMVAPLKECKVYFSPVQEGTGDPSPDNVRPITGWTGMDVYRTGKNLFDKDAVTDKFWIRAGNLSEENPLGTIRENASGYTLSQYIPVHPNTIYTIKYNVASQATAAGMVFFSEQNANSAINGISLYYQTYINSSTTREYYTFTTPINCHYIRVSTPPKSSNVQLELGSTATDYESYQGTTLSIDWTDSTGIVYGGYVDLITGEIWQTHRQAPIVRNENDPYWNSWGTSLMYNATTMGSTNGKRKVGTIVLSDTLTPIGGTVNPQNVTTLDEIRYYGVHASYPQYLFMANPDGLSSTEWRKWLYDTYPNANICYELETPILLTTLTPTQLKTLRGTNNIRSNAGDVSVSYWKH